MNNLEISKIVSNAILSAVSSSGNLAQFDGYDGSDKALKFIESYEALAKDNCWTDVQKLEKFYSYLSHKAKEWYKYEFIMSANSPTNWRLLKFDFIELYLPNYKKQFYREELSKRKQDFDEPVAQYIVYKRLECLGINHKMSDKEIILYVYENMLPSLKKELFINEYNNLDELKADAEKVENSIKFMKNEGFGFEYDQNTSTLVEGFNLLCRKFEEIYTQLNELRDEYESINEYEINNEYELMNEYESNYEY